MLFFLHGFLGNKSDWDELISHLPRNWPIKAINLPGHGNEPMSSDIALSVHERAQGASLIVGYSAGGRVALELQARFPNAYPQILLVSSHLGFDTLSERATRLKTDQKWIDMLQSHPIEHFLKHWYNQPLFQTLDTSKILPLRKNQDPYALSAFLDQYSIAKKPRYTPKENTMFVCGKEDLKYRDLYRKLPHFVEVENAGHAVHLENPKQLAKIIYEHYTQISGNLARDQEVSRH